VHDREHGDRSRDRRLVGWGRGAQSTKLTARGAVEHLPPARPQALTEVVGRLEVALEPALDALGQQLFGFVLR
jgi:hypothetical protein